MPRDDGPNLSMSFLDLLLSALGGVALLVLLFAASRGSRAREEQRTPPKHIVVSLSSDSPADVLIGREIGLYVAHSGDIVYLRPGEEVAEARLSVTWPTAPRRMAYTVRVKTKGEDEAVTLCAWVKQATGENPAHWPAQLAGVSPMLSGKLPVSVHARWSDAGEGEALVLALDRSNGFVNRGSLP